MAPTGALWPLSDDPESERGFSVCESPGDVPEGAEGAEGAERAGGSSDVLELDSFDGDVCDGGCPEADEAVSVCKCPGVMVEEGEEVEDGGGDGF